jgi:hypothetical protein
MIDRNIVLRLARDAVNSGDGSELSGDAIERFAQLVFLEAAAPAQPIGYIIPGGLPALKTKDGWLIVYGQQTGAFTEPIYACGVKACEQTSKGDQQS